MQFAERTRQKLLLGFCMGSHPRLGNGSLVPERLDNGVLCIVGKMLLDEAEHKDEVERQLYPLIFCLRTSPPYLNKWKYEIWERLLETIISCKDRSIDGKRVACCLARSVHDNSSSSEPAKNLCSVVWAARNHVHNRIVQRMTTCSWEESVEMNLSVSFNLEMGPGFKWVRESCFLSPTALDTSNYSLRDCVRKNVIWLLEEMESDGDSRGSIIEVVQQRIAELLILQACVFPICTEENRMSILSDNLNLTMINFQGETSITVRVCHEFQERLGLLSPIFGEVDGNDGKGGETKKKRGLCMVESRVCMSEEDWRRVTIRYVHNYLDDCLPEGRCKCRWCKELSNSN